MNWIKKYIKSFLTALLFIASTAYTNAQEVEMATGLRSSGKIYVVVAVLMTIFLGIVIYLIALDRKITRIENTLKIKK
jgi:hypothetical protein